MAGGRPLKFSSVEEMEKLIEDYFKKTKEEELTITGLALALDTDRKTLINYENRDEFFYTIKKAKTKIENAYEKSLRKNGRTGDIFALKNFGWTDKQEIDSSINVSDPLDNMSTDEIREMIQVLKNGK